MQGRFAPFGLCWDACGSPGRGLEPRQQCKFCGFWWHEGMELVRRGLTLFVLLAPCWGWKGGFSLERLYNARSPPSPCPVPWCWGWLGCMPPFPSCCYSSEWCCWCLGSALPGCGHPCKAAPSRGALQQANCGALWGMETPKLCYFGNHKLLSWPKMGRTAVITPLVWLLMVWATSSEELTALKLAMRNYFT